MVTPAEPEMRSGAADSPSAAAALLRGLGHEHRDVVDRLATSPSLLPRESRNLAEMLAFQARLTRQFFDLQFLLLEESARLDTEIAAIDAATVAASVASAAADTELEDGVRQMLAALAADIVRTPGDVESVSKVLDDAFMPDELHLHGVLGAVAEIFERCRSEADAVARRRMADARARAATMLLMERVEACDASMAAPPVAAMVAASEELADDLDALLAQFDDGLPIDAEVRWADDVAAAPAVTGALIVLDGTTATPIDSFWDRGRARTAPRRRSPFHSSAAAVVVAALALLRVR